MKHEGKTRKNKLGAWLGWTALALELTTIAYYIITVFWVDIRSGEPHQTGAPDLFTQIALCFLGVALSFLFSAAAMILSWRLWICRIAAFIAALGVACTLWLIVALSHLNI